MNWHADGNSFGNVKTLDNQRQLSQSESPPPSLHRNRDGRLRLGFSDDGHIDHGRHFVQRESSPPFLYPSQEEDQMPDEESTDDDPRQFYQMRTTPPSIPPRQGEAQVLDEGITHESSSVEQSQR